MRADEIRGWLHRNPGYERRWLILDDQCSGTGLDDREEIEQSFITLCNVGVGLTHVEFDLLRRGLQRRNERVSA